MIPSTPGAAISPLRQRMLDDMRKLAGQTQAAYVRAVRHLSIFLGRSPDTASAEDLRRFQLALVDRGTSPITINSRSREIEADRDLSTLWQLRRECPCYRKFHALRVQADIARTLFF